MQSLNSCDENADCIDEPEGYTCQVRRPHFLNRTYGDLFQDFEYSKKQELPKSKNLRLTRLEFTKRHLSLTIGLLVPN